MDAGVSIRNVWAGFASGQAFTIIAGRSQKNRLTCSIFLANSQKPLAEKVTKMLVVKTRIGPSTIHGIGCFADQFIPKGTLIWLFIDGFDQKISTSHILRLSDPAKEIFLKYSYLSRKGPYYVLCFDDARFFNHSFSPNVAEVCNSDGEESYDVAARNILPGEELTCNYESFEADFDPTSY